MIDEVKLPTSRVALEGCPDLIRSLAHKRLDGVALPAKWPVGWVPLPVACAVILHEALGDPLTDTWVSALSACMEMSNSPQFNDEGDMPENRIARWLIDYVADACSQDILLTGFRPIGGGAPVHRMPTDWWDLESPELRFRTWSIDPDSPLSAAHDLPCWVYVERESLKRQLDRIYSWRWKTSRVTVPMSGQFAPLGECVASIAKLLAVTNADAFTFLIWLAANSSVPALAETSRRAFRGVTCEAERDWPVPAALWDMVDPLDPRHGVNDGLVYVMAGDSEYWLGKVSFEVKPLSAALRNWRGMMVLPPAPTDEQADCDTLGALPANAKPNDKRYEAEAHQAARLVRVEGVSLEEAARRVAQPDPMRKDASIIRAIRQSFDLMYDRNGKAIRN